MVEVAPPITTVTGASVYNSDGTAIAALTNVYATMSTGGLYVGRNGLSEYAGLSADELTLYDGVPVSSTLSYYYTNKLFVGGTSSAGTELWSPNYNFLFLVNSAIESLNAANSLTPSIKQQLLGESYFLRAFFYFHLVNLFGDIPMPLTSNYKTNESLHKMPQSQIWQQIIADLKNSQSLLNANYLDGTLLSTTTERVRPTKGAATALLARAYLYTASYDSAQIQATNVINNATLYSLDTLNGVFLKNSNEAIWQLQPVQAGWNTPDAEVFIIPSTGPTNGSWPVYLSSSLLGSFEPGDQRRLQWVDSVVAAGNTYYYPFKYKSATFGNPVTEYEMMLRLGEQYLIRAEAEANGATGGIASAIADLNMIRNRAGLQPYIGNTGQEDILHAILHERQVELFTELGHRWLDLKRTSLVDSIMASVTPVKAAGAPWRPFQQIYPLPIKDLETDPNLNQNTGY
ncbi:MAG: RagB/SusD family nutrient uptake outer membrane protein [Puia sp.]|nr:RagB/SusD family nutrient uptake outer membrane protein [Puia sp.]